MLKFTRFLIVRITELFCQQLSDASVPPQQNLLIPQADNCAILSIR